jgi:hypothetical protein
MGQLLGQGHALCRLTEHQEKSTPVKDILKVVAGMVVYAVDTLLMNRKRFYTYKDAFLDGSISGRDWMIERRQDCRLCHPQTREPHTVTSL